MNLKTLNSQIVDFLKHPDLNSSDFDIFTKFITEKDNVKLVNNYLNRNKNMIEIGSSIDALSTRKFISIFLFLKFPEIYKIDSHYKIGKELLNLGKQVKFLFKSISIYLGKTSDKYDNIMDDSRFHNSYIPVLKSFFRKFNLYLEAFDTWKRYDLEYLIFKMSLDYYKFEKKMKDPINQQILPELFSACAEQKKKIIKYVKKLDAQQGILKFGEYLDIIKEYQNMDDNISHNIVQNILTQKISSTIHSNIMVEEWDKLESDLEDFNFDMLAKMLVKIKEAIRECVPNKKHIHIEIEEIIDEEFIINQIKDDVFNIPDFKKMIDYLLSILRKFQSPSEDDNTNLLETELNNLLDDYEYNLPFIIRFFLENIYIRFDNIRRQYYLFITKEKK
jgi:hypothetical protein